MRGAVLDFCGFRMIAGSNMWPSTDPEDLPVNSFECPLIGCMWRCQFVVDGAFPIDSSPWARIRFVLAHHLRGHAAEILP